MRIEKLDLQHQELLKAKFAKLNICLSEYSFANLYLFRKVHNYEVVFTNKTYIRGKTRDGVLYHMPTEVPLAADFYELQNEVKTPLVFFPISGKWLDNFPVKEFNRKFCPGDSDYLYSIQKLQSYPGRGLSGQRNLVKQFKELYDVNAKVLDKQTVNDAIEILNAWQQGNQKATDYESCLEALQLYDKLGLNGIVYYVDGKPAAFIIGESLCTHTYVIKFIKAITQYKGIYPFVYQHYSSTIPDNYRCIDLEQDIGIYGLRKSKQSYHPDKLEPKWRIRSITNPAVDNCV
jgi:uncharacterized protein